MNIIKAITNKIKGIITWFKHASFWKKLAFVAIVAIVIFIATGPLRTKPIQYTTDTVSRESITDIVSESGNVTNAGEVDISSTTTGVIQKLYVSNGDSVKSGQNLFEVKSTATPQDKATAYSNLLTAKNTLDSANTTLNTLQNTEFTANQKFINDAVNRNLATDDPTYIEENATWLAAEQNYKNQQDVISQAQAAVNTASIAYQITQDSIITAPASGIVQNLAFNLGDKVAAGVTGVSSVSQTSSSITSTPVLYIVSDQTTTIKSQVNEVDIETIKLGQQVKVTLPAVKDKTFSGKISKVDNIATNTSGVINYNVYITVDTTDLSLKPGMTANADIQTAYHDNALTIANEAIKPYQNGKAVQVLKNGKLVFIPVVIGIKGIDRTEIISGVSEGTKVVTGSSQPKALVGPLGGGGG